MKKSKLFFSLFTVVAFAAPALAVDPQEPGKASDGVKQQGASTAGEISAGAPNAARPAGAVPGKESDGAASPAADPSAPAAPAAKKGTMKYQGKITSVNKEAGTVTITDTKLGTHDLRIDEKTKFTKGESRGSWDDLRVGQEIRGNCKVIEGSLHQALSMKVMNIDPK